MVSYVQSLLANFATTALQHGRHKKKKSASSCFQHLSAKFALFWFWSHPITKLETDIQKWLRPELLTARFDKIIIIITIIVILPMCVKVGSVLF